MVSVMEVVPLVDFVPVHPSPAPVLVAVQVSAFVADQVNFVACPKVRFVGLADIETDGIVSATTA
jgi:hypothetical protein